MADTMTADEISELAEMLWNECRLAEERGMRLVPCGEGQDKPDCCCPLGAFAGARVGYAASRRYPLPGDDGLALFLGKGFWFGFDGVTAPVNNRPYELEELGARFREAALTTGFGGRKS